MIISIIIAILKSLVVFAIVYLGFKIDEAFS